VQMTRVALFDLELNCNGPRNRETKVQVVLCVLGAVAGILTVGTSHTVAFGFGVAAASIRRRGGIGNVR
jgi:hypothetical protein